MAFKFNAILKFNAAQATRSMKTAGRGFQRMSKNIQKAGRSLGKMNQGLRGLALAGLPATAGIFFATKTFANFEFQMKTVQSVLLATNEEMVDVNNTVKLLGATTEFSARQVGGGAEELARFGFSTTQIIGALPGVLNAASASGLGLAETTQIVAGQLGAFGLDASKAGEVADALALTTALTGTNMSQLGEAMKFAAPKARILGFTVAETASAMGVLANAGIRGSLAGTAFKNALTKLTKPAKSVTDLFGEGAAGVKAFNSQILDSQGKVRPMEVIMANFAKVVGKSSDKLAAAKIATEIFGLRGEVALSSFSAALGKNVKITEQSLTRLQQGLIKTELGKTVKSSEKGFKELLIQARKSAGGIAFAVGQPIPKLVALRLQIAGATGVAQIMRDIKLDSLTGQVILLKSAFEGINIELGEVFAGITRNLVSKATDFLSVLVVGFQAAKNGGKASEAQLKALNDNGFKKMLPVMIEFAQGFIEGFKEIVAVGKETFNSISEFLKPILGDTGLTTKEIGKMIAKIIVVGAIAAPILGGLAAAFFVLGPIIAGIGGAIHFIGSVIGIVAGIAQVAFGGLAAVVTGVSLPLLAIIAAVVAVGAAFFFFWDEIKTGFRIMVDFLMKTLKPVFIIFKFFGGFVIAVFNEITTFVGGWVDRLVDLMRPIGTFISGMFDTVVSSVVGAFNSILVFITPIAEKIRDIFISMGKSIFNAITTPFRLMISFVQQMVSKLAGTFLGKKALAIAGIDASELNIALGGVDVSAASTSIQKESVAQKALSQPPSAEAVSKAVTSSSRSGGGASGSFDGGTTEVVISFRGDAKRMMTKMVTKGAVENAERQGKNISNKRRLIQNGFAVTQ